MKKILILCTGNSCRSQLTEGYLKYYTNNNTKIYSAGIETHGVNLNAIKVMAEDGIDISNQTSNHVDEYKDINFDMVITVCDDAYEACPFFLGKIERFHQNFPDPAKELGSPEEILQEFRKVRDMIKIYAADFAINYIK